MFSCKSTSTGVEDNKSSVVSISPECEIFMDNIFQVFSDAENDSIHYSFTHDSKEIDFHSYLCANSPCLAQIPSDSILLHLGEPRDIETSNHQKRYIYHYPFYQGKDQHFTSVRLEVFSSFDEEYKAKYDIIEMETICSYISDESALKAIEVAIVIKSMKEKSKK